MKRISLPVTCSSMICLGHMILISTHSRTMPACKRGFDNHFIVLSHWNITPQARHIRIISNPILLFWQWVNQFCVELPFLCQGRFDYQPEIFLYTIDFQKLEYCWCLYRVSCSNIIILRYLNEDILNSRKSTIF